MIKKTVFIMLLAFVTMIVSGYRKPHTYTIDAEKNAYFHNNVGLNYLQDGIYYAAIQEFKTAISLLPDTQVSAVFYTNLGNTYMLIGHINLAEDCYLNALKLYGLNFQYYINLAKCYKAMGQVNTRLQELDIKSSPYNKIMKGLLLIESGNKKDGMIMLDEFCAAEPDLIITSGIKQYLKSL